MAALLLWLMAVAPSPAVVVATVLSQDLINEQITYPYEDRFVGHDNWTSHVIITKEIDFDGDGVTEITILPSIVLYGGGASTGIAVNTASHARIVGISLFDLGYVYDHNYWIMPYLAGEMIGADTSTGSGNDRDLAKWHGNLNVGGPGILWQALGIDIIEHYYSDTGSWFPYFGVRFEKEDGYHYGWAQITPSLGAMGILNGWAWETEPDTPIVAGAISSSPEPATLSEWLAARGESDPWAVPAGGMLAWVWQYLLGTDRRPASQGLAIGRDTAETIEISLHRRPSPQGATLLIEWSEDLHDWSASGPEPIVTTAPEGTEEVVFRIAAGAPGRYVRLRATIP